MSDFSLERTMASLQSRNVRLELTTPDICFLTALAVKGKSLAGLTFEEEMLYDIYEQVCSLMEPDAPNPRKRATSALQRLREQRLLGRVDGAGLVSAGEYSMSRLASAIVDFFLEDDALSRESLSILTKALLWQLAEIKTGASQGRWSEVAMGLRTAVGDLINGIERRQQGLDLQQQGIRERIASLLQGDWFAAVGRCEELLDDTARTLGELHGVLLEDAGLLNTVLSEIEELAQAGGELEAHEAALSAMEHVDRVCAWGVRRQAAWSEYYQYVQRYLRTVVRLDPQRAMSHRLQEHISSFVDAPYFLVVAEAEPTLVLREPDRRPLRLPATRPLAARDLEPDPHGAREGEDLGSAVEAVLDSGATRLSAVLAHLLPDVPSARRYLLAGRATEEVSRLRRAVPREGKWQAVLDMEIEDWELKTP